MDWWIRARIVRSGGVFKRFTTYAFAWVSWQVGFIRLRCRRFMDAGLHQVTGPW